MTYNKEEGAKIIELLGGKDNISSLMHCVTRLRFVLKDESKVDVAALEKLAPTVKGVFKNAGQLHIIIGNDVDKYYVQFVKENGLEELTKAKETLKQEAKKNMNPLERGVSYLADIFIPLLPAIITGGLILGARNVMELEFGGNSLLDIQFWAGVHHFLWLLGEAIFHFLPVGIAWSVATKMGTPPILGIVMGITLVSPQLLNAWALGDVALGLAEPGVWDFGFFTLERVGYQAQVIPAILAAVFMCIIERWLRKKVPSFLYLLVVPFVALVIGVFMAHLIIGPFGRMIGNGVAAAVNFLLGGDIAIFRAIGSAIFGFFYGPLVITGVHQTTMAIEMQMVQAFGGTPIFPLLALSNMAQGSAVLAFVIMTKKQRDLTVPAMLSAYLGVTEPALFGVNLRWKYPMLCAMIGSASGAVVCGLGGVLANGIGLGGIPAFLTVQPRFWPIYFVAMAITIGVSVLLTMMLFKKNKTDEAMSAA